MCWDPSVSAPIECGTQYHTPDVRDVRELQPNKSDKNIRVDYDKRRITFIDIYCDSFIIVFRVQ